MAGLKKKTARLRHFRYEHRSEPILAPLQFYRRVAVHAVLSTAIVSFSLGIGVAGYHFIEGFSWVDAFHNASMILSGMGPANEIHSSAGKIFASLYALFSGMIFLVSVGFLAAPVVHRILHRVALDD
ncbi:MAG: hypothetical protein JNM63_06990 [Spirochaetia bacterium]|nr:hypothetical protein [Spirochaetia bacterium]